MVKHFDHVTIVVKDLDNARRFFALLGFEQDQSVVISGPRFSRYMLLESHRGRALHTGPAKLDAAAGGATPALPPPGPDGKCRHHQPPTARLQPRLLRRRRYRGGGEPATSQRDTHSERRDGLPRSQ